MAEEITGAQSGTGERRDHDYDQDVPIEARVRDDDLEPHAGLRYIARLFKFLAVLLAFLLIAEIIVGFMQDGGAALMTLMVEATRILVFACFLWAAGDLALMLIESNHDLRAARILLGRLNRSTQQLTAAERRGGEPPPSR